MRVDYKCTFLVLVILESKREVAECDVIFRQLVVRVHSSGEVGASDGHPDEIVSDAKLAEVSTAKIGNAIKKKILAKLGHAQRVVARLSHREQNSEIKLGYPGLKKHFKTLNELI